jgi:hypothetical protein
MRSRAWISCRKIEQVLASGIIAPFLRVACELARPLAIDSGAAVSVAVGHDNDASWLPIRLARGQDR